MQIVLKINWILTVLLSISTGIFKVLQQETDIELFKAIVFDATATTVVGVIQLLGGLLLISGKTRRVGAWIMVLTFIIASIAVFMSEMYVFGVVSLLFIVMAYLVIYRENNLS